MPEVDISASTSIITTNSSTSSNAPVSSAPHRDAPVVVSSTPSSSAAASGYRPKHTTAGGGQPQKISTPGTTTATTTPKSLGGKAKGGTVSAVTWATNKTTASSVIAKTLVTHQQQQQHTTTHSSGSTTSSTTTATLVPAPPSTLRGPVSNIHHHHHHRHKNRSTHSHHHHNHHHHHRCRRSSSPVRLSRLKITQNQQKCTVAEGDLAVEPTGVAVSPTVGAANDPMLDLIVAQCNATGVVSLPPLAQHSSATSEETIAVSSPNDPEHRNVDACNFPAASVGRSNLVTMLPHPPCSKTNNNYNSTLNAPQHMGSDSDAGAQSDTHHRKNGAIKLEEEPSVHNREALQLPLLCPVPPPLATSARHNGGARSHTKNASDANRIHTQRLHHPLTQRQSRIHSNETPHTHQGSNTLATDSLLSCSSSAMLSIAPTLTKPHQSKTSITEKTPARIINTSATFSKYSAGNMSKSGFATSQDRAVNDREDEEKDQQPHHLLRQQLPIAKASSTRLCQDTTASAYRAQAIAHSRADGTAARSLSSPPFCPASSSSSSATFSSPIFLLPQKSINKVGHTRAYPSITHNKQEASVVETAVMKAGGAVSISDTHPEDPKKGDKAMEASHRQPGFATQHPREARKAQKKVHKMGSVLHGVDSSSPRSSGHAMVPNRPHHLNLSDVPYALSVHADTAPQQPTQATSTSLPDEWQYNDGPQQSSITTQEPRSVSVASSINADHRSGCTTSTPAPSSLSSPTTTQNASADNVNHETNNLAVKSILATAPSAAGTIDATNAEIVMNNKQFELMHDMVASPFHTGGSRHNQHDDMVRHCVGHNATSSLKILKTPHAHGAASTSPPSSDSSSPAVSPLRPLDMLLYTTMLYSYYDTNHHDNENSRSDDATMARHSAPKSSVLPKSLFLLTSD